MLYLSLFSGGGGGDLAAQHMLGWTCSGYVEWDDYCQKLLRRRQDDGALDRAPIYGDIRTFLDEGYADAYAGMVDVITGGFPCQPFSTAGNRRGANDERNMWPATIECIRTIRPRYAFLENVRGLVSSGYFGTILGDLAESGYDARWRILSAAEMGAPHRRDRLWIAAVDNTIGDRWEAEWNNYREHERNQSGAANQHAKEMAVTQRNGLENSRQAGAAARATERPRNGGGTTWWQTEPDVGRVADGVANRVDRLTAIGNGQVPAVAATAWRILVCADKPTYPYKETNMNLDTITSVRLDADAIEKLVLLSQATGLSRSETIRYLIMEAKLRTETVVQDVLVPPTIEVQHDV